LEKAAGAIVHFKEGGPQLGLLRFRRAAESDLGQSDAHLLGDCTHGLGEGDVLDFLHEGEDVAGDSAPEAMKELAGGVNRKRGSFLVMEGAEPRVVLRAGFPELDVVPDDT